MNILTGLDKITARLPQQLKGKKAGILCHAPSINSNFTHIINWASKEKELELAAVFGPQHGLFGQTQDNMIEWEASDADSRGYSIFSLYGRYRKPSPEMLRDIEVFIIDLQDIGARPYTYIWTMKHCMEACGEQGIPVWILDRPNPVGGLGIEGPMLKREYFTFVGGAEIPMMHSMTIGEIALWLRDMESIKCDLNIIWMEAYERKMMYRDTGLPWVIPSPNMPTQETAVVYPGMVLVEALNLSEARGTTTPFELFGAPGLNPTALVNLLESKKIPGCRFRQHDFIHTFNKYSESYCRRVMIHVHIIRSIQPVYTAMSVFNAIIETSPAFLEFNPPPYEYEYELMPFDILAGSDDLRKSLLAGGSPDDERQRWNDESEEFKKVFSHIKRYN